MCPIEEPVICPIMVGRDYHVAFIQRVTSSAADGRGQTVLLTGEAGIGKTRLISAFEASSQEQGWLVLRGSFFEPDRSAPYSGLIDLLRRYLRSLPAGSEGAHASLGDLALVLPELDRARQVGTAEVVQDKRWLLDAFSQFIAAVSENGRPALVLEDLHWADDASLELILHLARLASSRSMLVLLTYRSDEVHASLGSLIAGLERERLASEVSLHRLGAPEVDMMLRAMLGRSRPVRAEILQEIHELTDGNPFFVEEIARSLAESGAGVWDSGAVGAARIPHSVDESVRRRVGVLSANARLVLELAAVTGRRFDFPLLLRLSSLDEAELLGCIRELIAAQLVTEESAEWFSFRHALTRQAIYSGMLQRERASLHGRIQRTIPEIYADSIEERYADLAYHSFQAADWPQALEYSIKAGQRALRLFSPAAAVEHFTRALDAAGRLHETSLGSIHRSRGKAYETLGEFDAALLDYEASLATARAESDRSAEWESTLDLGMLWAGKDYARCGEYLRKAAELAQSIGDKAARATTLNRLGNWHVNMEEPRDGVAYHQEALQLFIDLDDEAGIAGTYDLLGMATLLSGDLVESTKSYRRALDLFEKLGERQAAVSSLATLPIRGGSYNSDASVPADSLQVACQDGVRALKLAQEVGWRSAESYAQWDLALSLGPQGEYGQGIALAESSLRIATDIQHTQWQTGAHCALGNLYLDLLAFDKAKDHLTRGYGLAREVNSLFFTRLTAASLSLTLVALAEPDAAEALLVPLRGAGPPFTLAQRQIECAWAELLLARNAAAEALECLDTLIADAANLDELGAPARLVGLRGLALFGLGRLDEAEAEMEQAIEACRAQGRRNLAWRFHLIAAEVSSALGAAAKALSHHDAAVSLIEELARTVDDPQVAAEFSRMALPGRSAVPALAEVRLPLTSREMEIASLVAQGLTNRAIAESLVISERTVESHVANSLGRLGFSSRSQLAAWVVQHREQQ